MKKWGDSDRRTVLQTVGMSIVGSTVLAGTVSAGHADQEETITLEGEEGVGHWFDPATYHTEPDEVTWKHNDETGGGLVHNVHIHEHGNNGNRLMSSGALEYGDTYDVTFVYDSSDGTLTLSDTNQSKTIQVAPNQDDVEFGVHCDFHLGAANIEGSMEMEGFIVDLP